MGGFFIYFLLILLIVVLIDIKHRCSRDLSLDISASFF